MFQYCYVLPFLFGIERIDTYVVLCNLLYVVCFFTNRGCHIHAELFVYIYVLASVAVHAFFFHFYAILKFQYPIWGMNRCNLWLYVGSCIFILVILWLPYNHSFLHIYTCNNCGCHIIISSAIFILANLGIRHMCGWNALTWFFPIQSISATKPWNLIAFHQNFQC